MKRSVWVIERKPFDGRDDQWRVYLCDEYWDESAAKSLCEEHNEDSLRHEFRVVEYVPKGE